MKRRKRWLPFTLVVASRGCMGGYVQKDSAYCEPAYNNVGGGKTQQDAANECLQAVDQLGIGHPPGVSIENSDVPGSGGVYEPAPPGCYVWKLSSNMVIFNPGTTYLAPCSSSEFLCVCTEKPPTTAPSATPTSGPQFPTTGPAPPTRAPLTPTKSPSLSPSAGPMSPTQPPSRQPSVPPSTSAPSSAPSGSPTATPSRAPTAPPTSPSAAPSVSPRVPPSSSPTGSPKRPTAQPTAAPTSAPTVGPTVAPVRAPSRSPSAAPTTPPSAAPSPGPQPTAGPMPAPSRQPTAPPTLSPQATPSASPTTAPTAPPTASPVGPPPTASPSGPPPTASPSGPPPTASPSNPPPTASPVGPPPTASPVGPPPTGAPTGAPSRTPSGLPSASPQRAPTTTPSRQPTAGPAPRPTVGPSAPGATSAPSLGPSSSTEQPTSAPSAAPRQPGVPTAAPAPVPVTLGPTAAPTSTPTAAPGPVPPVSSPPSQPPSASPASPSASPSYSGPLTFDVEAQDTAASADVAETGVTVAIRVMTGGRFRVSAWADPRDCVLLSTDRDDLSKGLAWALKEGRPVLTVLSINSTAAVLRIGPIDGYHADFREALQLRLLPLAVVSAESPEPDRIASVSIDPALLMPAAQGPAEVAAAGALVGMSPGAAGAAQQLVLLLESCGGDKQDRDKVPRSMHPLGLPVGGSECLGADIFNIGLVVTATVLHWLAGYAAFAALARMPQFMPAAWRPMVTLEQAQGVIRFPSLPLFLFAFFYQGNARCAWLLIFEGTWHSGLGAATLVVLVYIPFAIARKLDDTVPLGAYYRPDDLPRSGCVRWFAGSGEWVSKLKKDPITYRATMQLRTFHERRPWYSAVEFGSLMLTGLATAIPAGSYTECGHIRLMLTLLAVAHLVVHAFLRPHARSRDNWVTGVRLALTSIGLGLASLAYYTANVTGAAMSIASLCLFLAVLCIMAKMLMDAVAEAWIFLNRRRTRLQALEWEDCSEASALAQGPWETLLTAVGSDERTWKGLLRDARLGDQEPAVAEEDSDVPPSPALQEPPAFQPDTPSDGGQFHITVPRSGNYVTLPALAQVVSPLESSPRAQELIGDSLSAAASSGVLSPGLTPTVPPTNHSVCSVDVGAETPGSAAPPRRKRTVVFQALPSISSLPLRLRVRRESADTAKELSPRVNKSVGRGRGGQSPRHGLRSDTGPLPDAAKALPTSPSARLLPLMKAQSGAHFDHHRHRATPRSVTGSGGARFGDVTLSEAVAHSKRESLRMPSPITAAGAAKDSVRMPSPITTARRASAGGTLDAMMFDLGGAPTTESLLSDVG